MEEPDKPVEGELVGEAPASAPKPRSYFQPLSGLVILGIDWLAFGMDFASGFLALAAVSVLAFVVTFAIVAKIQRKACDSQSTANLKALLGAIAAGVPFPVTGTIVGAWILMLSGLPHSLSRLRQTTPGKN
jgi:hypothetical protein